jgi:hypothetical protein
VESTFFVTVMALISVILSADSVPAPLLLKRLNQSQGHPICWMGNDRCRCINRYLLGLNDMIIHFWSRSESSSYTKNHRA